MRRMLLALIAILVSLAILLVWMAGGIQSPRAFELLAERVEGVEPRSTEPRTSSTALTVVTWNIAWGYGLGSDGTGRAEKSREEMEATLRKIGQSIDALGADVAFLQEIDFDSKRSHQLDQARLIATAARMPYTSRVVSWRAEYIPFPYWPPSLHYGRVRSGGAIVSRYPLTSCRGELLEKPSGQFFLYRMFYLFRYLQRCELDLGGGRRVRLFNTHLEAFDRSNREIQARRVAAAISEGMHPLIIFGGDLNTVPPEATVRKSYPDETATDHSNDQTLSTIRQVSGIRDVFTTDQLIEDEQATFTFPAHAPNRKLDYLFVGSGWRVKSARVAREVGDLSDHLPLVVEVETSTVSGL